MIANTSFEVIVVLATPIGGVSFKGLSVQNMILDSPLDLRTIQNSFAWKTRFEIDDLGNMTIQKLIHMKMIFELTAPTHQTPYAIHSSTQGAFHLTGNGLEGATGCKHNYIQLTILK